MLSYPRVENCCGNLPSGTVRAVQDAGQECPSVGTSEENATHSPPASAQPHFKDCRLLALKLGLSFALLIVLLLGTAYLTLDRMQDMNAGVHDALRETLVELQMATSSNSMTCSDMRRATSYCGSWVPHCSPLPAGAICLPLWRRRVPADFGRSRVAGRV